MRVLLPREGYRADHERVQRLCRDEGLRVRARKRKRSRVGASTIPGDRLRAGHPNHVRALDFVDDQTADCRTLTYPSVTGEFAKHALAIQVERSMTGNGKHDPGDDCRRARPPDHDPQGTRAWCGWTTARQMTSNAVADWCRPGPAGIVFIDPGSPWQNAYVESFTGRLRDELLTIEVFHTLLQATIMAEDYRQHYKQSRPHSSLGYPTPDEFARQWSNTNPGPAKSVAH